MSSSLARTQSFTDEKGNRFIVPSYIIYPNDATSPSGSDVILKAMAFSQALRITLDKGWLSFDPEHFPHVSVHAQHHNFFHGAATVYLFAGPDFDAIKAESLAA